MSTRLINIHEYCEFMYIILTNKIQGVTLVQRGSQGAAFLCDKKEEEKKNEKSAALLLTAAMAAMMIAGCGSDSGSGQTQASGAEEDTLVMVTEAGFAPYEYTEDGETVIGVDVDIANEIANELGMKLEIQNTTFDGALTAVQQGKADFAAAGISISEERDKTMDFSIEYATSRQVAVVNKEAGRLASIDDINGDTIIGVQAGTVADTAYCADNGYEPKRYNKFMEAALDLKNDKLDCIIMDELPAQQMVEENDDLTILDGEVMTDKYAIAVQEGNQELLDKINPILQKLIDEGKIDEFTLNHTTK